ncbi:uncharacterized protein LOC127868696 [Dreissena polymorpha]|uniref:Uncharacterized protein n=1 Tax=Dreissena polymorpha TaxID=45954 RepID=A0A9D4MHQ7_DREPO|nr:uncharacterized protein LOC127868696 [Dreissena polymorpha]KAH3876441.1 hypothetical protein DPMN_000282 [Dreissena polymorpha]
MSERRNRIQSRLNCGNKVTLKLLLTFCRLNVILNAVSLLPLCATQCPTNYRVQAATQECFREYSIQKVYVDRSERRLFSGIDIEILRAYCSAYLDAYSCVRQLMQSCPTSHHKDIKTALASFADDPELTELCKTHRLYELYAQYMMCFSDRGKKSDWCFDKEINSSVMHVYQVKVQELCNRMVSVTRCIESNIRLGCGEQAAELVHLLVKPTVPGSGQCVYPLNPETTGTSERNQIDQPTNRPSVGHMTSSIKACSTTTLHSNIVLCILTLFISILFQFFTNLPS